MSDGTQKKVVGVDHIDGDRVVVEFTDGSTATYTVGDLASLPNERVKPNLQVVPNK